MPNDREKAPPSKADQYRKRAQQIGQKLKGRLTSADRADWQKRRGRLKTWPPPRIGWTASQDRSSRLDAAWHFPAFQLAEIRAALRSVASVGRGVWDGERTSALLAENIP
jgi:hypothetical protein